MNPDLSNGPRPASVDPSRKPGEGVSTAHADAVELRLRRVLDALRWVSVGARTGAALATLLLAGLALVVVDAVLPLPSIVRLVLGVLWLLALLRVPLGLIPEKSARRAGLPRAARLVEDQLSIRSSALMNALQLRPLAAGEGLPAVLATRAVERGREVARASEGKAVVSARPAGRAWLKALGLAGAIGALALLAPRVFAMVLPRYLDPMGDHPAFTQTRFDVSWSPDPVIAADDVAVVVELGGPLPASLSLVMIDENLNAIERVAMTALTTAAPEGSTGPSADGGAASAGQEAPRAERYQITLKDLRQPVRFHVAGETGRSRLYTIEPVMRPRLTSTSLVIVPPAYTGQLPRTIPAARHSEESPALALVGSSIEMRLTTTLAIARLDREEGGGAGEISVSANSAVRWVSAVSPGRIELLLRPVGDSGLACEEAFEAVVEVAADAPPVLEVLQPGQPGQEMFVLEGMVVPVRAQARDDIALSEFALSISLVRAGSESPVSSRIALLDGVESGTSSSFADHAIDTAALGARAGDTIELSLSATDNRPDEFGGAQTTTVGPIRLSILDRAEFARRFADSLTAQDVVTPYEKLVEQTQALERDAQELANKADELRRELDRAEAKGQSASDQWMERARELSREIERFAGARDGLRDSIERRLDMPPAVAFDEEMREPLEKLRDRVERLQTPEPLTDSPAREPQPETEGAQPEQQGSDQQQSESQESPQGSQPQSQPRTPESGAQPSQPGEQPESSPQEQQSEQTPPSESTSSSDQPRAAPPESPIERARVGEWLRSTEEQLEQNAEEAGVAADEAALDVQRPADALELADQLQRALEGLDETAKQQRQLADRIASTEAPDPVAMAELAARQMKLLEQLDGSVAELTSLGNRAGFEVPGGMSPSEAGTAIGNERRAVQDALAQARSATDSLPLDPASQSVRGSVSEALSIALTALYESTDPVLGALGALNAAPRRIDDEGFEETLPALQGTFEGAHQILDELQRRLDDAEGAVLGVQPDAAVFGPERSAPFYLNAEFQPQKIQHRGTESTERKDQEIGAGPMGISSGARVVMLAASLAVGAVQPGEALGLSPEQTRVMRELARARLKVDRLRATLRQAQQAYTPPLPNMGQSAVELAERATASEAADHMIRASEALEAGDLALARSESLAAAEALESLYEEPPQGGQGQPEPQPGDVDQPLQLNKSPSESQQQQGEQSGQQQGQQSGSQPGQSQGGSSSGGGKPSTLDQLRANRQRGEEGQPQGEPGEDEQPGDQPGDQPGEQPGEQPGQQPGDQPGQQPGQQPSESQNGQGQGEPSPSASSAAQQRAKFFNERMYETDAQPTGETAIATSSEQEASATEQARSAESPAAGPRSGLAAARAIGGTDAETTFQHVPPGYRGLVGQYFLRIAQDQASPADASNSAPGPTTPTPPPSSSPSSPRGNTPRSQP